MLVFADPKEWSIELPDAVAASLDGQWRSLPYSQAGRQWDAYLSQLCLDHLLPWLQSTYEDVRPWLSAKDWPGIWEIVAGCALYLGDRKLILIPSHTIDDDELVVPQEWVDLPDWSGDYYLALRVQIDSEGVALRVGRYASHQTLKQQGQYDPLTRTYQLNVDDLSDDMATLTTIAQFCPDVQTRTELAPIATLPEAQARNLLDRLASPNQMFPRLAVPFATWGALIQTPSGRQAFYQQRQGDQQGQAEADGPIVRLSQWLDGVVEAGWQSIEELLGGTPVIPQIRRMEAIAIGETPLFRRAKLLQIGSEDQAISLALTVTVNPLPADLSSSRSGPSTVQIQVQLHPLTANTLPPNLIIELCEPDQGNCLQTVTSQDSDTYIQLRRFRADPGESFQVRIRTKYTPGSDGIGKNIHISFSV
jgi:hypothetical protein